MNKVILMGRLTKDPEIRYTQNNIPICNFINVIIIMFVKENYGIKADCFNLIAWNKS